MVCLMRRIFYDAFVKLPSRPDVTLPPTTVRFYTPPWVAVFVTFTEKY